MSPMSNSESRKRMTPTDDREAQDVEALADSIGGCFSNVSDLPEWMRVAALGRYMRPLTLLAARAVLASDWLARVIADAKAEAWERGWADAQRSRMTAPLSSDNPYRAEATR